MKQVVCSKFAGPADCEHTVEAASSEAAMEALKPHYMEAHQDMMAAGTEETRKQWFADFTAAWEAAPEM